MSVVVDVVSIFDVVPGTVFVVDTEPLSIKCGLEIDVVEEVMV